MEIFGIPAQALYGQLALGLVNGAFYALLSLGLAIIFGLLNLINFAHGAQYMLGAYVAWMLLSYLGIGFWGALVVAPLVVAVLGMALERGLLRYLRDVDQIYGLLLTFGVALILEGLVAQSYGWSGMPYANPLPGSVDLGFMRMPMYRLVAIAISLVVCLAVWIAIERTKLGAYLRAASEDADMVQAFGVNIPRLIMLTYGFGVGLAGLAGVVAAPVYQVSPAMGSNLIIVVFAVVVIGGMGSIAGSVIAGFGLGLIEGLTKVFYPAASTTVIFFIMILILIFRPSGLFGSTR
ncbi:amino acid/amide ABC transporter membrane protein 1, HAAT family [Paracoccus solventivorans]|uniref:Amino acid/amide ABC transporter membrane protein 1, HAAT family n=1 Tax=Paracoccus solventivorans TaxID=53463 RepID=A0A1M7IRJ0_9RHOB|nr:branched-chain amino acid ABC transporter permease [Paracoccus solventivorans]SHM43228.1 amino acid/amide ABC transporter membrane protein 1, HAAT family [Paracoccus solventivorans]